VPYDERELLDRAATILEYDFKDYLTRRQPYLTTDEVKRLLRQGFTVGAHSIDHPRYSTISQQEQLRQTIESVNYVKTRFGLSYGAFAFPHSDDGVSTEFFTRARENGGLDITFGTAGLMDDMVASSIQRVNFERPFWPVRKTMRFHLARGLYKRALGKQLLRRA
jgi:peptidoglycan/xylan/chitin deacetylase (PgdA/CDA1 family)